MSLKSTIFNYQSCLCLRKVIITGLVLNHLLIGALSCWAMDKTNLKQSETDQINIMSSNAAGFFYPDDPNELNNILSFLLSSTENPVSDQSVYGLISPHAGYIYSGKVAAKSYQAISNRQYKTIIILAPSHNFKLDCAAIYSQGAFQTPLGLVRIDQLFAEKLIKNNPKLFQSNPDVFAKEHAIEVQLPFLQKTQQDFKIVPILFPQISYEITATLAQSLAALISDREDVLLIASSDLSHYHDQQTAIEIDQQTLNCILTSQPKQLFDLVKEGKSELCGSTAVIILIQTMQYLKVNDIQLLQYATSADSAYAENPDKNRVVGYAAVIFTKPGKPGDTNQRSSLMLDKNQKKELMTIAHNAIINIVEKNQKQIVMSDDPQLREHRGAFVTIYKNNALRGCIGLIEADQPLINVVNDMAVQAAIRDPRFSPLSEEELDDINLEISIISPIEQITDINQIKVGKHGLIIRKGYASGLLLPQVATEYNWTREQFLEQTCGKAGLNKDAWKQGAQIFIFSAEVFGDKD